MISIDILEIIKNLPSLLQYYAPGACFLFFLQLGFTKKIVGLSFHIASCVISFITISFIVTCRNVFSFPTSLKDTPTINAFLGIVISIILGLIVGIALQSKYVYNLFVNIFHLTLNANTFDDVIDFKNGSNLKVNMKEKDYYFVGIFEVYDNINSGWLGIHSYIKIDKNTHETIESYDGMKNRKLIIRFSNIDTIEVLNKANS